MRRILDFRIVRWEFKVLYVAVAWIVGFVIVSALASIGVPIPVVTLVNVLTFALPFALAVRIFRGQGEPVEPARAWWRITAWPTLSRRLGVLFVVVAAFGGFSVAVALSGTALPGLGRTPGVGPTVGGTVESALLALLYLNSAVRLKRAGITKPDQLPKSVRLK
ncbi:hypothetical protein [Agromyces sp. NPDC058110]|uniref:hypothetical protein n=1 Tax=Agromyces sp. NPDC058110 TaxID=3346345 RepID=UPI0036D8EA1D